MLQNDSTEVKWKRMWFSFVCGYGRDRSMVFMAFPATTNPYNEVLYEDYSLSVFNLSPRSQDSQ